MSWYQELEPIYLYLVKRWTIRATFCRIAPSIARSLATYAFMTVTLVSRRFLDSSVFRDIGKSTITCVNYTANGIQRRDPVYTSVSQIVPCCRSLVHECEAFLTFVGRWDKSIHSLIEDLSEKSQIYSLVEFWTIRKIGTIASLQ